MCIHSLNLRIPSFRSTHASVIDHFNVELVSRCDNGDKYIWISTDSLTRSMNWSPPLSEDPLQDGIRSRRTEVRDTLELEGVNWNGRAHWESNPVTAIHLVRMVERASNDFNSFERQTTGHDSYAPEALVLYFVVLYLFQWAWLRWA